MKEYNKTYIFGGIPRFIKNKKEYKKVKNKEIQKSVSMLIAQLYQPGDVEIIIPNKFVSIKGGSVSEENNKVFDLNKSYPKYKKENLQENLNMFYNKYGETFNIKYEYNGKEYYLKNVEMYIAKKNDGEQYYDLLYDVPGNKEYPCLEIAFIDRNSELNNTSYLAYINKSDDIPGTVMVKIAIEINKILGAKTIELYDDSSIKCDNTKMSLSFIKLLEKGTTFYTGLGFKFNINKCNNIMYKFKNEDDLENEINNLINEIRKLKVQDIIKDFTSIMDLINLAIKENFKNDFIVSKNNSMLKYHDNIIVTKNNMDAITELNINVLLFLSILNNSNDEYFYKYLIKLFKNNCSDYIKIMKIINYKLYSVSYKDTEIILKWSKNFIMLNEYRHIYTFIYEL